MFSLQQLEKTKKEQLAIGAYCVKFGLTKADIEEVLHRKRCREFDADSRKKVNKVESTEMSKLASMRRNSN